VVCFLKTTPTSPSFGLFCSSVQTGKKSFVPIFVFPNFLTKFCLAQRNMAIISFGRNFSEVSLSSVTTFPRNIAEMNNKLSYRESRSDNKQLFNHFPRAHD
jgi:hypothetical protein